MVFNPLQGMQTGYGLLAITADGYKPGEQFKTVEEEEKVSSR